jgi:hypothetical protein
MSTIYVFSLLPVAPNGIIYAKPEVRKGLLGRMLIELLNTRIMVKQAMKGITNDKVGSVGGDDSESELLKLSTGPAKNT